MRFSLGLFQFCKSFSHVLAHGSAIVPEEFVLHEAHALAFDSMRNDAVWPAGLVRNLCYSLFDCRQIMAIYFAHSPSESTPLVGQRIQIDHFFDRAEALYLVVVDDDD